MTRLAILAAFALGFALGRRRKPDRTDPAETYSLGFAAGRRWVVDRPSAFVLDTAWYGGAVLTPVDGGYVNTSGGVYP